MKKSLPLGAVVMLMILALATIGIGYGLWSKTLFIFGTVNTGNLDAFLSVEEVDQLYDFNANCPDGSGYSIGQDCDGDGFLNDDWEWLEKDVAECVAELDDTDPQIMRVTITEAYPSYNCFIKWDVHNTGTIPMDVYGPAYFYEGVLQGSAINVPELHVNGWPPPCFARYDESFQLDPGERIFCNLHVHLNQPAEEKTTYEFEVRVWGRQWNEYWMGPPWLP
jgi:hypothetical protein